MTSPGSQTWEFSRGINTPFNMPRVCRRWVLVPFVFLLTFTQCGGLPDLSSRQKDVLGALLDSWERGGGGGWIPSREATAAMESFQARQTASLNRLGEDKFILLHMNPGAGLGNRLVAVVSGFLLAQVRVIPSREREMLADRMHPIPFGTLLAVSRCSAAQSPKLIYSWSSIWL